MSYKSPNDTNKYYLYFRPYLLAYNQNNISFLKSFVTNTGNVRMGDILDYIMVAHIIEWGKSVKF